MSAEKDYDNKTSTAAPESQTRPESGLNNENGNVDAEILLSLTISKKNC